MGGGDILTNPPFKYITEFIEKGLELTERKLAIFARIQLLESKKRWERIWVDSSLKRVYVFVNRIRCFKNDDRDAVSSSAVCYCWFVWDKEYDGEPVVDWIYQEK